MSEQEQQTTEPQAQESPPPQQEGGEGQVEQEGQTPETNGEGKPEGWEEVEFTPEQQARFNRIYGQMKQKDKVIEQMATDQRKLFERLDNIETSQQERETGSQLDMLRTAEREALEVGDTTKAQELRDEITDLKIQSAQPKPKEEPKPQVTGNEFVNEYLTPNRMTTLQAWVAETGDDGQPLRPWASEDHPHHKTAMRAAWAVIGDPSMEGSEIGEYLTEVDKVTNAIIGTPTKAKRPAATVLGNDGDAPPRREKGVNLDENQKMVARAMFPGMKASEAETRYAKSLERLND